MGDGGIGVTNKQIHDILRRILATIDRELEENRHMTGSGSSSVSVIGLGDLQVLTQTLIDKVATETTLDAVKDALVIPDVAGSNVFNELIALNTKAFDAVGVRSFSAVLVALETLTTAGNVDLAAIEVLQTEIKALLVLIEEHYLPIRISLSNIDTNTADLEAINTSIDSRAATAQSSYNSIVSNTSTIIGNTGFAAKSVANWTSDTVDELILIKALLTAHGAGALATAARQDDQSNLLITIDTVLDAILSDTSRIPTSPATEGKQDTLITANELNFGLNIAEMGIQAALMITAIAASAATTVLGIVAQTSSLNSSLQDIQDIVATDAKLDTLETTLETIKTDTQAIEVAVEKIDDDMANLVLHKLQDTVSNQYEGCKDSGSALNMNVDGSVTPVSYFVTGARKIRRLTFVIRDATGQATATTFGAVATLANGVKVRHLASGGGVTEDFTADLPIKTNLHWCAYVGTDFELEKAYCVRWSFHKAGGVLELAASEKLEILISDDLTGLDEFYCFTHGTD